MAARNRASTGGYADDYMDQMDAAQRRAERAKARRASGGTARTSGVDDGTLVHLTEDALLESIPDLEEAEAGYGEDLKYVGNCPCCNDDEGAFAATYKDGRWFYNCFHANHHDGPEGFWRDLNEWFDGGCAVTWRVRSGADSETDGDAFKDGGSSPPQDEETAYEDDDTDDEPDDEPAGDDSEDVRYGRVGGPLRWWAKRCYMTAERLHALGMGFSEEETEDGWFLRWGWVYGATQRYRRRKNNSKDIRWGEAKDGFMPPLFPDFEPHRTYPRLVIVEGDADVTILRDGGISDAFTLSSGTNTRLSDVYIEALKEQLGVESIVLAFDADDAGTKAAHSLSKKLRAHDITVGILDVRDLGRDKINPLLAESDIRDARSKYATAQDLAADVLRLATMAGKVSKAPYRVAQETFTSPETQAGFILKDLIPYKQASLIAGAPNCGKSVFLGELMHAVCMGKPLFGLIPTEKAPVFLMTEHTPETFRSKYGHFVDQTPNLYVWHEPEVKHLFSDWTECLDEARKVVTSIGARLIIVDTIGAWASGYQPGDQIDMNDYGSVAVVLSQIQALPARCPTRPAVVAVTHTKKGTSGDLSLDSILGSTIWSGKVQGSIFLMGRDAKGVGTLKVERNNQADKVMPTYHTMLDGDRLKLRYESPEQEKKRTKDEDEMRALCDALNTLPDGQGSIKELVSATGWSKNKVMKYAAMCADTMPLDVVSVTVTVRGRPQVAYRLIRQTAEQGAQDA